MKWERRTKKRPLTIVTGERRFGESTSDQVVGTYLSKHRIKRVRKGHVYLQRCCGVFCASLISVFVVEEFSHAYYFLWVCMLTSFFLMLPTVLPMDNARITAMIQVSCANTVVLILFCFFMARRQHYHCQNVRAFCLWNFCFWAFHGILQCVVLLALVHATYLSPGDALNRFWRVVSVYFFLVGVVSVADKFVLWYLQAFSESLLRVVIWNWIITAEEFTIGILCSSTRFKLWIWHHAASYASIRVKTTEVITEESSFSRPTTDDIIVIPTDDDHLDDDDVQGDEKSPASAGSDNAKREHRPTFHFPNKRSRSGRPASSCDV